MAKVKLKLVEAVDILNCLEDCKGYEDRKGYVVAARITQESIDAMERAINIYERRLEVG